MTITITKRDIEQSRQCLKPSSSIDLEIEIRRSHARLRRLQQTTASYSRQASKPSLKIKTGLAQSPDDLAFL
jgi:hypothetical protein